MDSSPNPRPAAPRAPIKLSICIATFRRGAFIGETLDSIVHQLTDEVELIVVDGASPDNTPEVLARYVDCCPSLRYVREPLNSGIDRDYDLAVSYARGEYCWLMTDDDLMIDGAVAEVLARLGSTDLVVVNAEVRNKDLSRILRPSMLADTRDRVFDDASGEALFIDTASYLSFIGGVVVRRAFWRQRSREPYYGTLFVHIGTLFQAPAVSTAAVIGRPLLAIRFGNAMWSSRSFEIWMFKWPDLVWSFGHFSMAARAKVTAPQPFRNPKLLLWFRAIGGYSISEYRQFLLHSGTATSRVLAAAVARLPGKFANFCCAAYYVVRGNRAVAGMELYDLSRSTYATGLARRVDAMQESS